MKIPITESKRQSFEIFYCFNKEWKIFILTSSARVGPDLKLVLNCHELIRSCIFVYLPHVLQHKSFFFLSLYKHF